MQAEHLFSRWLLFLYSFLHTTKQEGDIMAKLRNGALYIRVSTADQTELSPDAQQRLLLDYAKKNGIIISKDFIFEESVSGRHADKRPKFQEMIGIAKQESHPIDVILVWKYSRFARNQEESIVYKSLLKKSDVDVISISEPLIDGPFGTLIERIIEWMDEYYSIRLSGEVIRGMKEKALKHGYQSTPCLGYDAVGGGRPFVINESEYRIVQYIMDQYDLYDQDETAIARKCNDLGFRSKRGNLFEQRNVDLILKNPFYTGTVVWNGISFEGSHETRLSKERFEKRIALMRARRRPAKARNISTCKHWLSGLLRCSVCGATLSLAGSGSYRYFQCWKYSKGFHKGSQSLSAAKAEAAVCDYFDRILTGADFTYTVRNIPDQKESDELDLLRQELDQIAVKEARVKLAYENGIDTLEEYKENREELQEKIDAATAATQPDDSDSHARETLLKEIRSVSEILKDPAESYERKGLLLRSIVDGITYDKEKNRLYFNFFIS